MKMFLSHESAGSSDTGLSRMDAIVATDFGSSIHVNLFPSDRGLDLVFVFDGDRSPVRVSLEWHLAADVALRMDMLGADAGNMLAAGLDPYNSKQRSGFELAALQVASERGLE